MSPSGQVEITQADFSGGMARDVAPPLISQVGAFDLVDLLLDEDGSLYRRGGSVYKSKGGLGTDGLTWAKDVYLLPGRRTIFANGSDFGVLGSDDETVINLGGEGLDEAKQSAVLEDLLYIGGGTLYGGSRKAAVYSTGSVTVTQGSKTVTGSGTTWNTLVDAGMLFHIGTERVYIVASVDSTTQITLRDAYEGSTGGSKSYTLNPTWTIGGSDPYETYDYVSVCANRFVFGKQRTIAFTEVDNPHSFTNTLGTTNEHTLPEGAEIVGVTTAGQTSLAFTTAGIWTLDGLALAITDLNGNAQHRIQPLSTEFVLAGAAGLAGSGQAVVVPSADGIFLMDGISQPVRVSKPIDRLYRKRLGSGYRFGGAEVYRNHYLLPLIDRSGNVRETLVCRLDRPLSDRGQRVYPWTRLTGDAGETAAFTVRNSTGSREPLLLGAQAREPSRVVDCSGFFEPSRENEVDADGSVHSLDIITRDIQTGAGTLNTVRELVVRRELIGDDGPELKLYYSDGTPTTGAPQWNEVTWNDFQWADEGGASFSAFASVPVGDERHIFKARLNKELRYARFRIRSVGPSAFCALRSFGLRIRPSRAARR